MRRVRRAFKGSQSDDVRIFAADVEASHTDPWIWDRDPTKFLPARWNSLTKDQKKSFMPFGCGPFVCPAKQVFGPWIIALLVGALAKGYKGWHLDSDAGIDWEELKNMRLYL